MQQRIKSRTLWFVMTVFPAFLLNAGTKDKSHSTLVLPASEEQTDILSTGPVRTTSPVVQPLDDTFCVAGSDNTLLCQGVDSPARIRLPREDKLSVHADGSVCTAIPGKAPARSEQGEGDVIFTGESISGLEELMLPSDPEINAWLIQCRKDVKTEPSDTDTDPGEGDDQGYDSPVLDIEISSENWYESTPRCKGKQNTTCACGQSFGSVRLLNSHRQASTDARCKGKQNTTCACGQSFDSASLLYSHHQGSTDARCKGKQNTTCACGESFDSASLLKSHRRGSTDTRCKGKLNTTCACGQSFDSASLLTSHRLASTDERCKGKLNKQKRESDIKAVSIPTKK